MPSDWPEPAPRVASWPEFEDTWGNEAVDLCETAGLYLDPWQEVSLRVWLGTQPGNPGRWACRRCGMVVPRQDGKGAVLEARQLCGLYLFDWERLIIHTAHEFKTAEESFLRLRGLIEDSPLRHRLARNGIRTGRGQEAIILEDGSRVKFLSRSKRSGRGFTSDLLIYDEAMVLDHATVGASGPTQSARPNPQTIYTATAGDDSSEVLSQVRDQGIEGTERLSFIEYSAGEPDDHSGEDVDLDDRDEWFRANPAMWGDEPRMTVDAVEEDRRMMDEENFARERLCIWWTGKRVSLIDPDHWQNLIGESKGTIRKAAIAWDAPPEKETVSIGLATDRGDGLTHLDLIEYRKGTKWAAPRLAELVKNGNPAHVAYAKNAPAASLHDEIVGELEEKKIEVLGFAGAEMAAVCGQFLDRVNAVTEDGESAPEFLVHNGPHVNVLASSVDALRKRENQEGGFVFHRRDTASDISPVMALALASYALGKPSKKKQRSGEARF